MRCEPACEQLLGDGCLKKGTVIDSCLAVDDVQVDVSHEPGGEDADVVEEKLERRAILREADGVAYLTNPRCLYGDARACKPVEGRFQVGEAQVAVKSGIFEPLRRGVELRRYCLVDHLNLSGFDWVLHVFDNVALVEIEEVPLDVADRYNLRCLAVCLYGVGHAADKQVFPETTG